MRRARTLGVALAVILAGALAGPAAAQPPAPCGAFRVEWNRGELSPTADKLEGFVYNDSACSVADVRIHVVAVDGQGRPLAETMGWVFGDIPPGTRGYFAVPLTSGPAADYRVDVVSFDQVSAAAGGR